MGKVRTTASYCLPAVVAVIVALPVPANSVTLSVDEAGQRGLVYQIGPYPQVFGLLGYGAAFTDLDADGDPDLVLLGAGDNFGDGSPVGIFENDGTGNFTDRSSSSGIPVLGDPSGVAAGDIDGDGLPELYFSQLTLPNVMVHNDGRFQFTDISATAGIQDDGPGMSASFGDFDGDTRLDLYVVNYNGQVPGTKEKDNKLYRNLGNGVFEDVSVAQTVDDYGYGFQAVWFDYDLDGDVDLYLSNDRGHRSPLFRSNQLWRNDNGQLVNVSVGSGADGALFSMGVACGDFDNNGRPDLYVTNVAAYEDGFNPLYLNSTNDPPFTESSMVAGVDHWITSWGAIFYDYDNDGVNDLYVNNQFLPNSLYLNDGSFPSVEVAAAAGVVANDEVSYSAAIADVDNDGDMDLLTNNLNSNVQLFINYADGQNHWAKFRMVGLGDNVLAVGGRVITQVGGRRQVNEVLAGGNGFLGQNDLVLHVGLARAVQVDEVEVTWPGGSPTRTLTALPADATWTLYPPSRLGDADGGGEVTLADFLVFAGCFADGFQPGCEMMDFDGDSAIDLDDYDAFAAVYSEPLDDCDENMVVDLLDVLLHPGTDLDGSGVPDICEDDVVVNVANGCGDANADGSVTATDALSALNTAVGFGVGCGTCACDANYSYSITASDALSILKFAVGALAELTCPGGPFDVAWDGGGDGVTWRDRFNWEGDGVPRFCDRVTIDDAADPTITLSGAPLSIHSLNSDENLTVSAEFTLRNDSSVNATLTQTAGSLTADAAFDLAGFAWTSGTVAGTGPITATNTLAISGGSVRSLIGVTLVNEGTATWSGGTVSSMSDAVLQNSVGATFNVTGDVNLQAGGGSNNLFNNEGSFVRSAGDGTMPIAVGFNNSGSVHVQTGAVNASGGYTQTSGGSLTIDVGGTTAADIGRLTAAGVTLDGELAVHITGGYTPMLGDVLDVMAYTSRSGTFATLTGTDLGGGLELQESYGATALTFAVAMP
jgi:hypothetical protein